LVIATLVIWSWIRRLNGSSGLTRSSLIGIAVSVIASVGATVETTEGVVDAVRVRLSHAPTVGLLSGARFDRRQSSHSRTRASR